MRRRRRGRRGGRGEAGRRRDPGCRRAAAASTGRARARTSACPRRASRRWRRAADRRAWLSRPLGQPARLPGIEPERARELVAAALAARTATVAGWTPPRWRRCLTAYGVPLAPTARCRDPDAAVAAAARLGGPIALKASLPAPAHAGDIDAVLLGLTGEDAIRAGWHELRRRVRAAALPLARRGRRPAAGRRRRRHPRRLGQRPRPRPARRPRRRRPPPRAGPRDHVPPRAHHRRRGRGADRRLDRRRGVAGGLRHQPAAGPPRPARPHPALRAPAQRRARARRSRPQLGPRAAHRLPRARRPPAPRPARARRPDTNVVARSTALRLRARQHPRHTVAEPAAYALSSVLWSRSAALVGVTLGGPPRGCQPRGQNTPPDRVGGTE